MPRLVAVPRWLRSVALVFVLAAVPRFLAVFWGEWAESARVRASHAYTHARCVELNAWSQEPVACDAAARALAVSGFLQVLEAAVAKTPWCLGYYCDELAWTTRVGGLALVVASVAWRPRVTRALADFREKRRRATLLRRATAAFPVPIIAHEVAKRDT